MQHCYPLLPERTCRFGQIDLTAIAGVVSGFAAAISINLAIINSLPLPALDGGQMAFVLVEVARRKKVDVRVQENITGR